MTLSRCRLLHLAMRAVAPPALSRRSLHLAVGAAAAFAFMATACPAQEWPARPVTIVVGTAAGGGADILARVIAGRLSELLGQPFVIENVGNAVAAAKRVASAQPHGYIVDFGFASTHALHPRLYKRPFYDAVNDFTPVALVAEQPYLLVTRSDFPASTLMEFAAYVKANADKIQYGSGTGVGSGNHLSCELLNRALGIKVTLVPYRDQGQLNQDTMTGRVDYNCVLPPTAIPLIQAGRLKGIATTGLERLANLPALPTAHEQGLTGFDVKAWFGLFMPKGAPDPIVRRLAQATSAAMDTPALQEKVQPLAAALVKPERRSPEYLQKFVLSEIDKWGLAIREAGVSLD
jgi:tripartite-type tricarboxylate transporter receptor subunit TctC